MVFCLVYMIRNVSRKCYFKYQTLRARLHIERLRCLKRCVSITIDSDFEWRESFLKIISILKINGKDYERSQDILIGYYDRKLKQTVPLQIAYSLRASLLIQHFRRFKKSVSVTVEFNFQGRQKCFW